MRKTMKTFSVIVTLAMVIGILPVTILAEGYYYVDTNYIVLHPGETATIAVGADNAAGRVDWGSEGSVTSAGSVWLDNNADTITVSADSVGTGYITVYPTDIATYDDEVLDYAYTIQVDVVSDEPDAVQEAAPQIPGDTADANIADATAAQEQALQQTAEEETTEEPETQVVPGDVLTDGNDQYEGLTEEERLYTNVNGQDLYIIQFPRWMDENGNIVWNDEVFNLDLLPGFDLTTVNYKGMNVDTFQYKDQITAFVIKDPATDRSNYYVLKNDGTGFAELSYVTANGKAYIVVDYPENYVIPEGYQMVEMSLGAGKVHALKVTDDSDYVLTLKGYDVQVSPGLDSADPAKDLYYIYCLVDGNTQLYSYDSVEGTLQRSSITVYNEIPVEPETVIVYQDVPVQTPETPAQDQSVQVQAETEPNGIGSFLKGIGWNDMQIQVKVLLIALGVAILLIIILIILFATMSSRNKKKNKNRRNNIPPRSSGRTAPLNEDDDAFFSYVKTDENYDYRKR